MKCPKCNEKLIETKSPNEGYDMFVAEDSGDCIEWWDGVKMYKCSNDHTIYISTEDIA